jgi:hypothetical protein
MDERFAVLTAVVAVIGAVTGITGLVLSVLNFQRDASRLRVIVEIGNLAGDRDSKWQGPYVFVRAVNVGRRPIQLTTAGLRLAGGERPKLYIPPAGAYPLPHTLPEGEHHQVWALVSVIAAQASASGGHLPQYGYYTDATERVHRGQVPRSVREAVVRQMAET